MSILNHRSVRKWYFPHLDKYEIIQQQLPAVMTRRPAVVSSGISRDEVGEQR